MASNDLLGRFARLSNRMLNAIVTPILGSPLSGAVRPYITTIHYTGRRTGNTFTTPVYYRKRGDNVTIRVASPDSKTWWRNFGDDGRRLTIDLTGGARTGNAVSHRDDKGRVTVDVTLDP